MRHWGSGKRGPGRYCNNLGIQKCISSGLQRRGLSQSYLLSVISQGHQEASKDLRVGKRPGTSGGLSPPPPGTAASLGDLIKEPLHCPSTIERPRRGQRGSLEGRAGKSQSSTYHITASHCSLPKAFNGHGDQGQRHPHQCSRTNPRASPHPGCLSPPHSLPPSPPTAILVDMLPFPDNGNPTSSTLPGTH